MEKIRLTKEEGELYDEFRKVYNDSFPLYEQRTSQQQDDAFQSSHYHLDCYLDGRLFVGFIAYWRFDTYTYVEHFAIHPEVRGKGYGGWILKDLTNGESQRILLEIDPIKDDISAARLRFYQSYGFSENPFVHVHPAYRKEYPDHSLVVLTTLGEMTVSEYKRFNFDLTEIIMKRRGEARSK